MQTPWFDKVPKFRKEIKSSITKGEADIDDRFSIRLPQVVDKLGMIIPQIRKWALFLSRIKTFVGHLEHEFEAFDSELFTEIKKEMILEQDERKKEGLKVYSFTDTEVKMRRNQNLKRYKMLQSLQSLRNVQYYIESCCYWPSVNMLEALGSMTKFSVASEREYK